MADLNETDMEIERLTLEMEISKSKAKTLELKKNILGYKKQISEAEKNIPIQEKLTADLEAKYEQNFNAKSE